MRGGMPPIKVGAHRAQHDDQQGKQEMQIKNATPPKYRPPRSWMGYLRQWVGVLVLAALTAPGLVQAQEVSLPNQEYTESHTDLSVATVAGQVQLRRTWTSGRWYLNPAWADLRLHPDPLGGVLAVERAGSIYQRIGTNVATTQDGTTYQFDANNFIVKLAAGWRWYDRLGNNIDYDEQGRTLGYADPYGNKVILVRGTQGLLDAVQDHHGRTILSFSYDGQQRLTQAADIEGNAVSYQWSGAQLSQVTDAGGHVWQYRYDGQGQIIGRANPAGKSTEIVYMSAPRDIPSVIGFAGIGAGSTGGGAGDPGSASSGSTLVKAPQAPRVAGYKDESGANWNYRLEYDRGRRQYTIYVQRPDGSQAIRVYDRDGWLLGLNVDGQPQYIRQRETDTQEKIADARGMITTVQRNAAAQITKTVYPDGSTETTDYDAQGRAVRHTNVLGVVTTWKYDAKGSLIEQVQAAGRPEQRMRRYARDARGYVTSETYGSGNAQGSDARTDSYSYDDWGRATGWTNALGHNTQYAYNARGQVTSLTDPLGRLWKRKYDARGRQTEATDPLGGVTRYETDALGRLVKATSSAGHQWTAQYDAAGRQTAITNPLGQRTQMAYDLGGRLATVTSPSGLNAVQLSYDGQERLTQSQDGAGNKTQYEYGGKDSPLAGLLAATQYPTYRETYQYDQRGRQTSATRELGGGKTRVTRQAWDAWGQLVSTTDPAGKTTLLQYDGLGRLIQSTDPLAQVTHYSWDAFDRLTSLTDAKGNTHHFEYDKAGRLVKETRPLGDTTRYSYDAAGQLVQRIDAAGHTRDYSYDAAGRRTLQENKLGGSTLDERVSYSYDADARLSAYEQKDGSGELISSASYTLDALGRATRTSLHYGNLEASGSLALSTGQSFNADGQLAGHTYPDGSQQTYGYQSGRLAKVTLPNQSEISYQDYQWLTPTKIQSPATTTAISTDALQRPTRIEVKNQAAQTLAQRLYQYDDAGNITQIESDLGTTTYGYDPLDRLTQASPDNALQVLGLPQEQYSYDAVGNRLSSAHQPGTWSYNANNQLTQYPRTTPFSAAAPVDTHVSYTPQGHTQQETNSQGTHDYGYNAAERLIHYSHTPQGQPTASLQASYRYDPFGRRIAKSIQQGASTRTTYFIYSGQALMAEADATGKLTTAYGFNPQAGQAGLWSTDPIWQAEAHNGSLTDAATRYHYVHTDHLGTPTLATTKEGATSWKAATQAFGAAGMLPESSITMNLRLPGQYFDKETGAHYNFHRDYRPDTGRYVQADPIGLVGGWNGFFYAGANPLSFADPDGLSPWAGAINGGRLGAIGGSAFGPVGTAIGGVGGVLIGAGIGWYITGPMLIKPPDNAYDPNGPKAPGKPTKEDGFEDPKSGENWVPNPNGGRGGSSYGWEDAKGDVWCPTGHGGRSHSGPHWDVQTPGGGYRNVKPKR